MRGCRLVYKIFSLGLVSTDFGIFQPISSSTRSYYFFLITVKHDFVLVLLVIMLILVYPLSDLTTMIVMCVQVWPLSLFLSLTCGVMMLILC